MFKNRLTVIITVLTVLVVSLAISRPLSMAGVSRLEGTNDFYQRHPERIWEEAQPYVMDSATRSYIAWGEALIAAGKLSASGACANTTQENVFAGIPNNVDSATRSYIAWGLALQAKDSIRVCR